MQRIITPYGRKPTNNYLKTNLYDPNKDGELPPLQCRVYHKDGTSIVLDAQEYKQAKDQGNYFDSPWEARDAKEGKIKK